MHNFTFFAEKPSGTYRKSDIHLVILTFLLWGMGMLTLYFCSAGYGMRGWNDPFHFVSRQLLSSVIGFFVLIVLAVVDVEKLRKILPVIAIGSIVLCLMTWLPGIGVERNGARRWIKLPYFSTFQPSETIKFAMVLYLANLFDKQEKLPEYEKSLVPAIIGLIFFAGVIMAQSDFSTSFFVLLVGLAMFFVTGTKLLSFVALAGLGIPLAMLSILLKPYRVNRLVGFLAQDDNLQTFNYQLNMSKAAITDGGILGQGIGTGLTKLSKIPEIQSDYVFAGWTEAFGLAGVIAFLFILAAFGYRVYKICMYCGNRFASIATFGFGTTIVLQSLINIGVVSGALPSTGIPLPFFSSGGSSIIITLAMCGFMINASRIEQRDELEILVGE